MFIKEKEECIDKEEEEALGDSDRFSLPVDNKNAEVNEQTKHEQRATNGCSYYYYYYQLPPYIYRSLHL